MDVRHLVCLLVSLLKIERSVLASCAYHGSKGLTNVPHPMSSTLVDLRIDHNMLTQISQMDFNDIYPELMYIDISNNDISFVESGCFKGTQLRYITLGFNQLTSFPDFHEVSNTLKEVDVSSNKITKIFQEEINYLTKLEYFFLNSNPIISLPDLPMNLPAIKSLQLEGISFHCCCDVAWLRKPINIQTDPRPCISPTKWTNTIMYDIPEEMMLNEPCVGSGGYRTCVVCITQRHW
ncbi:hypothetical protein CAPTEDRAFT_190972 [Capitella teleta]|uniref:LRRCT domain-containing protein n=1 Tax=Capitella teleta TaxID=283909 RepID=R7TQM8_CAPTE|nr:hypothetical protein CAPTEDRAFT_190972 [Capitella teleta]|eukprot:ELT93791.1 hypothetical protein CAPTEDRAFT_190972 [Capitella teleta]